MNFYRTKEEFEEDVQPSSKYLTHISEFCKYVSPEIECVLSQELDIVGGKILIFLQVLIHNSHLSHGKCYFDGSILYELLRYTTFPVKFQERYGIDIQSQFEKWKLKRNLEDIDKPETAI